jgi:hypothetical protein
MHFIYENLNGSGCGVPDEVIRAEAGCELIRTRWDKMQVPAIGQRQRKVVSII